MKIYVFNGHFFHIVKLFTGSYSVVEISQDSEKLVGVYDSYEDAISQIRWEYL